MSALLQGVSAAYLKQEVAQLFVQDTPRKGPRREGTSIFQIDQGRALFAESRDRTTKEIEELKASYIFADNTIDHFLAQHRALPSLLREAIGPLKASFGPDKVFRLEISIDEDGSKMLYGIALWQDNVRTAAQALERFAESWWLDHMSQSTTDLAFIYRISR